MVVGYAAIIAGAGDPSNGPRAMTWLVGDRVTRPSSIPEQTPIRMFPGMVSVGPDSTDVTTIETIWSLAHGGPLHHVTMTLVWVIAGTAGVHSVRGARISTGRRETGSW